MAGRTRTTFRYAVTGLFLSAAGPEAAFAQEPPAPVFVDTKAMTFWAPSGPPPLISLGEMLTTPAENQFRRGLLAKTGGAVESLAQEQAPFKAAVGFDGAGAARTAAAQGMLTTAQGFVRGGARVDEVGTYENGAGRAVEFGYRRHGEQLLVGWTPNADTTLTLTGANDRILGDKQPNYTQDPTDTLRNLGKATLTQRNIADSISAVEINLGVRNLQREADNYTLRAPAAARFLVEIDRLTFEAGALARLKTDKAEGTLGFEAANDRLDAKRYSQHLGDHVISAYRFPEVETWTAGIYGDVLTRPVEDGRLRLGLRYDMLYADANAAHRVGQATGAGAALFNLSPQQLWNKYYGQGTDNQALDHKISGRLRYEHDLAAKQWTLFGDLSRMVRSPDNIERFHAVTGSAAESQVWAGNPELETEKHYKAATGLVWTDPAFTAYGRGNPEGRPAFRVRGEVWFDRINDFVTSDRARGQAGIYQSDRAVIYRNVEADMAGAELDVQANLDRHWSSRLLVGYTWANNRTDHRALYQVPPLEADLLVDYRDALGVFGTWNAGTRLRGLARQDRVDDSNLSGLGMDTGGASGAFAVLDLYGGLQIHDTVGLTFGVDNLLDRAYHEHLMGNHAEGATRTEVYAPGRTFYLRAIASF